jgi:hypothetical protein
MRFFNDGKLCKCLNKMIKKMFLIDCVDYLAQGSQKLKLFKMNLLNIGKQDDLIINTNIFEK